VSARAEELARRFEQTHQEMIAAVEGCSDAQWRATCPDEGWSVAVTSHHVARAVPGHVERIRRVADGQPLNLGSWDTVHANNARRAEQYADVARDEVLAMLRGEGPAAAALVRGLSDDQLDRTGVNRDNQTITAAQIVEQSLIGHITSHLSSIRRAK